VSGYTRALGQSNSYHHIALGQAMGEAMVEGGGSSFFSGYEAHQEKEADLGFGLRL